MASWKFFGATLVATVVAFSAGSALAEEFSARLSGFQELGSLPNVTQNPTTGVVTAANPTGAVLSNGSGKVSLQLHKDSVDYTLTYSNVGTTSPKTGKVSQAHIHFGKSRDSGGIMVFFCTNLKNAPPLTDGAQICPDNSGTVSGTWTSADVVAIVGQNVVAGDFSALVRALQSNTAYANVHTTSGTNPDTAFPAGEIRGQVHAVEDDHDNDNNQGHKH